MLGVGVQSSSQVGCEQISQTADAPELGILRRGLRKRKVMSVTPVLLEGGASVTVDCGFWAIIFE